MKMAEVQPKTTDTLDPAFARLLEVYSHALTVEKERLSQPLLDVDDTGSRLSSMYERLRQVVDYKEEHLVLRSIILRILKRRMNSRQTEKFGEGLVKELTLSGYLTNKTVPVRAMAEIDQAVARFMFVVQKADQWQLHSPILPTNDSLWALAAAEIEMIVVPHDTETGLVAYAIEIFKSRTDVVEKYVYDSPEALDVALTIAAHRVILKADTIAVAHRLLQLYIPDWSELTSTEISRRHTEVTAVFGHINGWLADEGSEDLMRHISQFAVAVEVLDGALKAATAAELTQVRHSPVILHERVKKQYQQLQKKVTTIFRNSVVRAGIYILLTKALLGLIIEVPLEMVLFGHVVPTPLILNTVVPPLLLFSLLLTTGISRKNQERVILEVEAITYNGRPFGSQERVVRLNPEPDSALLPIFYLFLYIVYGAILAGIGWILNLLHFTIVSGFFFYLFVSVVIYFSVRISAKRRAIIRLPVKRNVFAGLVLMPFLTLGKFINATFSQFNLFTLTLDLLLEAPFKSLVEIFASWRRFVDAKNNELY